MKTRYKLLSLIIIFTYWTYVGLRFNNSSIDRKLTAYFKDNDLSLSALQQVELMQGITEDLISYLGYFNILVGFFVIYLIIDLVFCYREKNR